MFYYRLELINRIGSIDAYIALLKVLNYLLVKIKVQPDEMNIFHGSSFYFILFKIPWFKFNFIF